MMRRCLLIIVGLVLATCVSCQSHSYRAQGEAEKLFSEIAVPGPETQSLWGMSEFHVFGRDDLFETMAAGHSKSNQVADSPETYEVTIPIIASLLYTLLRALLQQ
jgi:hypothetical protein